MKPLKLFFEKYTHFFTGLLAHLGIWGPMTIAGMDAAAFGIPMDPVIAAYAWKDRDHLWLVTFYCLSSALASAVGSLAPYWIGRKGGEPLVIKRIGKERLEKMRDRYESLEFFFVMVPCLLPPGTPMKAIILAAGTFEMRVPLFFSAVFLGRTLRFALLSYLTIRFGEEILHIAMAAFKQHLMGMLASLALLLLAIGFYLWSKKKREEEVERR